MTGPDSRAFSAADYSILASAGIKPESAEAQLHLLREGMHRPKLTRPCTVGDGITIPDPDEFEALGAAYQKACAEGRWVFFIPASGAATRMAESLSDPARILELRTHPRFADSALPELLKNPDAWVTLPKALMPFHRYGDTFRTPVEEHIREACALAPGAMARLHFTISPGHEPLFLEEVGRVLGLLQRDGTVAEVTHSFQDPATQTLALDENDEPFRDTAGNLLLRPGGHGSLLRNLQSCGGEFVWIRNIDNIPVERNRAEGRALRRAVGGMLMRAAAEPESRPTRVAGMVQNTGEPGGGPFWIEGRVGAEIRIIEAAEVDSSSPEQGEIFEAGTHFNPVDMACALRDPAGKRFRLEGFSDPSAGFVAEKTHDGRTLRALEWPGLWNGAMAGWHTKCVEIPLSQFAPVKTVADLLRGEHVGNAA
jgi:hypothetical protein